MAEFRGRFGPLALARLRAIEQRRDALRTEASEIVALSVEPLGFDLASGAVEVAYDVTDGQNAWVAVIPDAAIDDPAEPDDDQTAPAPIEDQPAPNGHEPALAARD